MEKRTILIFVGVFIILYVALTSFTPKATNTTKNMNDLEEFLRQDTVSENKYVDGVYNCFNFSHDLKTNAEEKGFVCHEVYIGNPDIIHVVVAFEIQNILIWVEPQDDSIINIFESYPAIYYTIWA